MRWLWFVCVSLLGLVVGPSEAIAWAPTTLEREKAEFDRKVEASLAEAHPERPELVELLRRAETARASAKLDEAAAAYDELLAAVPEFVHAERRRAQIAAALGNVEEATGLAEAAVARDPSPENRGGLAAILAAVPDGSGCGRARTLAREAWDVDTSASTTFTAAHVGLICNDQDLARAATRHLRTIAWDEPDAWRAYCASAMLDGTSERFVDCAPKVREAFPDDPMTYVYAAGLAAHEGDFDRAHEELATARDRGLDHETFEGLSAAIDDADPQWVPDWVIAALAGWASGLVVLTTLGWILSRATLAAARDMASGRRAVSSGTRLRSVYKSVLWLTCVYYYASVPVVLVAVLGVAALIFYGFLVIGLIPVKLTLIIGIVALVSLAAVVKSLFARASNEAPGERLDLDAHPRLREVLHEVAARVGTRPVDNVYLTIGSDIAVFERGTMLAQLRGTSERCLLLGVAVLEGLRLTPFKAILAHEYGHFSNRDTAGGGFALAVRRSLVGMAQGLLAGGAAGWYNPAWLFFRGFYSVFLRISQGASRLQEVLADRWAVLCYGAASFEGGLRHAIASGVAFDAGTNALIHELVRDNRPLVNLYRQRASELPEDDLQREIDTIIEAEPSPYDSHPRPADRFEWAHLLERTRGTTVPTEPGLAWDLFEDREGLERTFTERARMLLASDGVHLAAAEPNSTALEL